jgi:starvation-inducible outer membrane lipoprotein
MANMMKALLAALVLSACATAEKPAQLQGATQQQSIGADGLKNRIAG